MHARELVELAAVLSAHGPVLVEYSGPLPDTCLEQYWRASKCRLDRWAWRLKQFRESVESAASDAEAWPAVCGLLEEVLTGEVLTRVVTAVLSAHDRRHGRDEAGPIARSVLMGHLEMRNRVLSLLVRGTGIPAQEALRLEQLRRRTERWADILLGYLAGVGSVAEFAADPARVRDFAADLDQNGRLPGGHRSWSLVQAALCAAFQEGLCPTSPNADLNYQVASAVLECFPPELFHDTGVMRSLWSLRLVQATNDTQGMIDELMVLDGLPPSTAGAVRDLGSARFRRFSR